MGALLVGSASVVALGLAGCTTTTGGDPTVNAADAPAYRTSMSVSSSQSAASSSARESERQASLTTQAAHTACETLSTTSADAIDAVNAFVDAYNKEDGDLAGTAGPAVDALSLSADAVESSMSEVLPPELADAMVGWIDGADATAEAISGQASPSQINKLIDTINEARSKALRLCDATYR